MASKLASAECFDARTLLMVARKQRQEAAQHHAIWDISEHHDRDSLARYGQCIGIARWCERVARATKKRDSAGKRKL